jgi:hypothetical protein
MFLILYILFFLSPLPASADTGHIVISEIQAYGVSATDEFIRLYNPAGLPINISGWRLTKKTSSGSESNLVSSFADSSIIPAGADFLIAHQTGYAGNETPDARYSGASYSFADNNTIILKDAGGAVIDKAGFGTASDYEGAPAANPESGSSIKRLNNQDTDNNKNDFAEESPEPAAPQPSASGQTAASFAEYGDIVINETVPNPMEGKEWVELLNKTGAAINISGWKLSDAAGEFHVLQGEMAAQNFFTIETNNRLNNDGDSIYLSDVAGRSIHQLAYGTAQIPAPEKGESVARGDDDAFSISSQPTKNSANIFSSQNSASTSTVPADLGPLSIIEIMPNPEGSDAEKEYIKILNSSDTDIDIGKLYLDDEEGGSRPYFIPAGTTIKAGGELIFFSQKTKLSLNNSAGEARVLDYQKEELQTIEYEDAPEGSVYIFRNGKWGWESPVSYVAPTPAQGGSASGGKAGISSITATVIVPPGIFGSQIMYVDGRQLYMYSKDWPELSVGDKITAYGTPSTYYGEPRLKLKNKSSVKIISRGQIAEPMRISADEFEDENIGRYITIEGEAIEIQVKKIIIDARGNEFEVYDKTKENPLSEIKEKDTLEISGILSKYKDEFRILPTNKDDIKIIKPATEAPIEKNGWAWQYVTSTLIAGGVIGGTLWRRKKNANWAAKNSIPPSLD